MSGNETIVRTLMVDLEIIGKNFEELTDTDVREALHETLNYFFIWDKEFHKFPSSYGMFSEEGDRAVAQAVRNFLKAVAADQNLSSTAIGRDRLNLLQNEKITTPDGNRYDVFFGHVDEPLPPDPLSSYLFEKPDYID